MGTITINREDVDKLKGGDLRAFNGDERLANFLVNRFDEEAARERARSDEPTWVYNIWTYVF